MSNTMFHRIIVSRPKKKVTDEIVRNKLIEEIGYKGNVIMVDYRVEKMTLLNFQLENNPDDSYYQEVSSVIVEYRLQ